MKIHSQLSPTRSSDDGRLAFELGIKVGYWPCLKGPFLSLACGHKRLDLWYGLPSIWKKGKVYSELEGKHISRVAPWIDSF